MQVSKRQYWLDLFTHQTWLEFLAAGAQVSGYREGRWKLVQMMRPGDYLLCYLTGVSRWIGILEITGKPFQSSEVIWKDNVFPARVPVKVIAQLEPLTAVPVLEMKGQLSFFKDLKSPHAWTGRFRGSPAKWPDHDGEAVVAAIMEAAQHPTQRPFDPGKLKKVPPILKTASGKTVTIPAEESAEAPKTGALEQTPVLFDTALVKEGTAHTEIQWLLAKLGNDMGLDVWVAKNDVGKSYNGQSFSQLPRLRDSLPVNFDDASKKTVELIDVLWLKGNSILAAFEIESTTQIFSGLLRMADLIAMQPNLAMPLYIVAPSDRRQKVFSEVNRPVFSRLEPPMSEMCQFIAFEELRSGLKAVEGIRQYLKPDFIESVSESCQIDDAD